MERPLLTHMARCPVDVNTAQMHFIRLCSQAPAAVDLMEQGYSKSQVAVVLQ